MSNTTGPVPVIERGEQAMNVCPNDPQLAERTLPYESTEMFALVYEPSVTPVGWRQIVPVETMGPPVKPGPVLMQVTVPLSWGGMRAWIVTVPPTLVIAMLLPD